MVSLSFLAEVKTSSDLELLNAWEMAVYDYASGYTANPDNIIEMLVLLSIFFYKIRSDKCAFFS